VQTILPLASPPEAEVASRSRQRVACGHAALLQAVRIAGRSAVVAAAAAGVVDAVVDAGVGEMQ